MGTRLVTSAFSIFFALAQTPLALGQSILSKYSATTSRYALRTVSPKYHVAVASTAINLNEGASGNIVVTTNATNPCSGSFNWTITDANTPGIVSSALSGSTIFNCSATYQIPISLINNQNLEANKTVTFTLTQATGANLVNPLVTTVTVIEDDFKPFTDWEAPLAGSPTQILDNGSGAAIQFGGSGRFEWNMYDVATYSGPLRMDARAEVYTGGVVDVLTLATPSNPINASSMGCSLASASCAVVGSQHRFYRSLSGSEFQNLIDIEPKHFRAAGSSNVCQRKLPVRIKNNSYASGPNPGSNDLGVGIWGVLASSASLGLWNQKRSQMTGDPSYSAGNTVYHNLGKAGTDSADYSKNFDVSFNTLTYHSKPCVSGLGDRLSASNPEHICTHNDLLNALSDLQNFSPRHYVLKADIQMSARTIPQLTYLKSGNSLDGDEHAISGIVITQGTAPGNASDIGGLFSYIERNAVLKNVQIISPQILIGQAFSHWNVGGAVGTNYGGTLENVRVYGGDINGSDQVGGLLGWNRESQNAPYVGGLVKGCYADPDSVRASVTFAGALVGYNGDFNWTTPVRVEKSAATAGNVQAGSYAGVATGGNHSAFIGSHAFVRSSTGNTFVQGGMSIHRGGGVSSGGPGHSESNSQYKTSATNGPSITAPSNGTFGAAMGSSFPVAGQGFGEYFYQDPASNYASKTCIERLVP